MIELAVCPNSEEVIVFKKEGTKWIVEDVLKEVNILTKICFN